VALGPPESAPARRPPLRAHFFVVDTSNSGSGGSAQLSDSGGTTTLTVTGSDDIGQTLHMVATCGPRG
jgi:hypothetical protein